MKLFWRFGSGDSRRPGQPPTELLPTRIQGLNPHFQRLLPMGRSPAEGVQPTLGSFKAVLQKRESGVRPRLGMHGLRIRKQTSRKPRKRCPPIISNRWESLPHTPFSERARGSSSKILKISRRFVRSDASTAGPGLAHRALTRSVPACGGKLPPQAGRSADVGCRPLHRLSSPQGIETSVLMP